MKVDALVADVCEYVQPWVSKSQVAALKSLEVAKQANGIFVDGVQTLFKSNLAVGKDLASKAQESFERARLDGLKAVISSPLSYVPEGREEVLSAYSESLSLLTSTGDKIAKVALKGYEGVSKTLIAGDGTSTKTAPRPRGPRKGTVRKAVVSRRKGKASAASAPPPVAE